MELKAITSSGYKERYTLVANHIMQSWQWGDFRKKLRQTVLRYGFYEGRILKEVFQLTLHPIPFTRYFVGYLPKGPFPDQELVKALTQIGKKFNCAFIKIEPKVILSEGEGSLTNTKGAGSISSSLRSSPKPYFSKHNFIIDLTKSEEELLRSLHPKTRYNINVAKGHRVKIEQRVDPKGFEIFLKLYFDTTKRQGYFGHNENYHRQFFNLFKASKMARILIAFYEPPPKFEKTPLSAWMLVNFKDTLYYPYGGSSPEYKNVMANNLIAWEAIRLGKKLGLSKFDMWGALGPDANPKDSWFGFHKFKAGYGGQLVEYLGTYDLVFNWPIYLAFTFVDKLTPLKVFLLKLLKK